MAARDKINIKNPMLLSSFRHTPPCAFDKEVHVSKGNCFNLSTLNNLKTKKSLKEQITYFNDSVVHSVHVESQFSVL